MEETACNFAEVDGVGAFYNSEEIVNIDLEQGNEFGLCWVREMCRYVVPVDVHNDVFHGMCRKEDVVGVVFVYDHSPVSILEIEFGEHERNSWALAHMVCCGTRDLSEASLTDVRGLLLTRRTKDRSRIMRNRRDLWGIAAIGLIFRFAGCF